MLYFMIVTLGRVEYTVFCCRYAISDLLPWNTLPGPVESFAVVALPTKMNFNSSRFQRVCCHFGEYLQSLLEKGKQNEVKALRCRPGLA